VEHSPASMVQGGEERRACTVYGTRGCVGGKKGASTSFWVTGFLRFCCSAVARGARLGRRGSQPFPWARE
jgi:hypothetical protein